MWFIRTILVDSVSELLREHGSLVLENAVTGVSMGCFFNLLLSSEMLCSGDVKADANCV